MNNKRLLTLFGLKWNPFLPNIPVLSLWPAPGIEIFLFQIENLVMDGGFALMCGEPGLGKSKNLQYLAHNLERLENVVVGVMERPQSSLADFYREMGDLFGVNLTPSNRYGGFKALRERWRQHIKSTLFRPILLVDEAQEMMTSNLNELRLLGSAQFDSECLLTVILCGDLTLPERFRSNELLALGSRIRFRRTLSPYDKKELRNYLEYCLEQAGAPQLMTKPLMAALVEHSVGNLRLLNIMAAELLTVAAKRELTQLDEQLFLELYSSTPRKKHAR